MTCVSTREYFEYIAICNAWVSILGRRSTEQNWYFSMDDQRSLRQYLYNIGYLLQALHRRVLD